MSLVTAFVLCTAAARIDCVIDGDTFWLGGAKVRLADVNAPETMQAACPAERAAGSAAKARLLALLNAGPFDVSGTGHDRYGRLLRTVSRGGRSLGAQLVAEGLAEPWRGRRSNWCALLSIPAAKTMAAFFPPAPGRVADRAAALRLFAGGLARRR
jgi:micrococcal nuclease